MLDIDYLIYEVFKKRYPLDLDGLKGIKTQYYFAATKVPDGKLTFLGPK